MRVITFGELLLRLSAPGYNKLFQRGSLDCTFCGGEANVAVSLSNFGIDSAFITKLPNNDVGHAAERALNEFKVDTSRICCGEGRMGLYYLEKGASQRPSKIIYDRVNSAISIASIKDFDWNSIFEGADWFHFTGIDPALSQSMFEITLEACKVAKAKGLTVSCDLNYRKKLWSSENAQKAMKVLLEYVDVCIGNEEDAQMALGIQIENDVENANLNIDGYKKIAEKIQKEYGCKYVAFTLRESYSASMNGWSAVLCDSKSFYLSKKYEIQLVDRVGGGDSFAAGLIYGLITKMNNQQAIEFAVAASCLKQTIEGDFNRCSVEDVLTLMNGSGNGRVQR